MAVRAAIVLLILALGAGFASDANAVGLSCGDRAAIVERLASDYDEAPVSLGMAANGAVIEVHVSPERGNLDPAHELADGHRLHRRNGHAVARRAVVGGQNLTAGA